MSLEDRPPLSLKELAGRLETLESEWDIAFSRDQRREIDEKFKALATQIRERFGGEGQQVVDQFLSRHKSRRL